ncbi:Methylmalonyl Co-A mutase-associated GTPase MeaB/CobW/HypB/UreG, nucleotide-binding domain containing protein, putative [Leishmania lindenbergi]|uniref:Methylmalonyl Co-A mutase-associated GTPase MeaB/CobW/HypB n=1 Tax=Leishmania lindenbergi TaxID=651832 RepID=A0AAW3AY98_9TRYP
MNYVARPRIHQQILVEEIVKGNRRALAKAITLAESSNPADSIRLSNLLRDIHQTTAVRTVPRLALSGSPGAGKSRLLDTLGYYLCEKKKMRVGVLAVDPSSTITHGSILGDKTRMEKLGIHPNSYIRPSPSGGHLGGVTSRAWEVLEIFEAANFDVVFVETVGVGQSETQCKDLTDMMILLVPPASGDELQGIKKGIVEVADMVVVTKNDGSRKLLAQQTISAYTRAVMYTEAKQGFEKPVLAVSAEERTNVPELWEAMMKMWNTRVESGQIAHLRRAQSMKHFYNYFEMQLLTKARRMANVEMQNLAHRVWEHQMTPREAGDIMVLRTLREHLAAETAVGGCDPREVVGGERGGGDWLAQRKTDHDGGQGETL